MTVQVPLYLQTQGVPAKSDRQHLGDIFKPGVVGANDLVVSSTGAARGTSIAAGACYIAGTQTANQGSYRLFNDAAVTLTHDAAVSFPRLDQVVARIYDATENGGVGPSQATIEIVKGTETNGATLANRSGAVPDGSLPANVVRLADVLVPVGAATVIPSGNIGDRRARALFSKVAVGAFSANNTGIINYSTLSQISFTNELIDVSGWYDTSLSRFTPKVAGIYRIHGMMTWIGGSGTPIFRFELWKNGSVYRSVRTSGSSGGLTVNIDELVQFNGTTDYVELYAIVVTGTVQPGDANFAGEFVGVT